MAFSEIPTVQWQLDMDQKGRQSVRCDHGKFWRRGYMWARELGFLLLKILSSKFSKDLIGLYRDAGLAALKLSGPQSDRARKDIIRIFKHCGVKVTVETLLKQTDFLDVTLDLPTGRYWPFRKPSDTPLYTHAKSNH